MLNTSALIPKDTQPETLTLTDVLTTEGIYKDLQRKYPHRYVTLKNTDGDRITLYCSDTLVQPVLVSSHDEGVFVALTDEKFTASFAKIGL